LSAQRVIIVGGGAAGFFAAITCAEARPGQEITILEKSAQCLSKVRISGGGRCNVTHACFDARELSARYPRGSRSLIGLFQRFQPKETVEWFAARGVELKVEPDGRMFPVTNSSQTIIDCLLRAAHSAGVEIRTQCGVESVQRCEEGGFAVRLSDGGRIECDQLLLATGGCRAPAGGLLAVSLGHAVEPPVPSLFTFHIEMPWLRELPGVSVEKVEASVPGAALRECGPLLVTHWGLSGPVILRLSAWGARELAAREYRFPLQINWLPHLTAEELAAQLQRQRQSQASRTIGRSPLPLLPARLWEKLVMAAGIGPAMRWAELSAAAQHRLVLQLTRTEFPVTGKSLNKDEFVTCGGVRLGEVDFKTMESRICPDLHFAGELLDMDGITGGFNFQACWTTGWIAGRAMADVAC
jgi:predicted Rossmann fold flavoprotein